MEQISTSNAEASKRLHLTFRMGTGSALQVAVSPISVSPIISSLRLLLTLSGISAHTVQTGQALESVA